MKVFKLNLPIEIYKDALQVMLNVLLNFSHQFDSVDMEALIDFLVNVQHLDYAMLQKPQTEIYFIDCFAKINPNYNEQQLNEDRTIEEMQPMIFCQKFYTYKPDNRMFDDNESLILDKTILFRRDATVAHLQ